MAPYPSILSGGSFAERLGNGWLKGRICHHNAADSARPATRKNISSQHSQLTPPSRHSILLQLQNSPPKRTPFATRRPDAIRTSNPCIMPRPPVKRRRVGTQSTTDRVASNLGSSPRAELRQKLEHKAIGTRPHDSDDSDQLVTAAPFKRNFRNVPRQEIYASGGVAAGDKPGAHPSRRESKDITSLPNGLNTAPSPPTETQPQQRSSFLPDRAPFSSHNPRSSPATSSLTKHGKPLYTPLAGTPAGSTSILGTLQPRRRQNSILHLLGNDDSSSFSLGDEADFLPDAESTPLGLGKPVIRTTSTPLSSLSQSSKSRKRKTSPLATQLDAVPSKMTISTPVEGKETRMAAEPDLPVQLQSSEAAPSKTQQVDARSEDEIMAPPKSSSSPVPSPVKGTESSSMRDRGPRKIRVGRPVTTEELQQMLPKKPRPRRERKQTRNEFDIPPDSSASDSLQNHTPDKSEESFIPPGKGRKRRSGIQTGKTKVKGRNIRATSTLSPITYNRSAKSPWQQRPPKSAKSNNYGSRRRPKPKYGSGYDKENQPDGLFGPSAGQQSEGDTGSVEMEELTQKMQAERDRFAEIDKWDMDFEEVDVSSSDPAMR